MLLNPPGGKKIMDARLDGKRPSSGVFVVPDWQEYGRLEVKAEWGKPYDWRFVAGLQVFLLHDEYSGAVSKTAADIVQCRPDFLAVISSDYKGYMIECN